MIQIRITILIILNFFLYVDHYCQKYFAFPDSNSVWTEVYYPPITSNDPPSLNIYVLSNQDTIINSIQYHKLFYSQDTLLDITDENYSTCYPEFLSTQIKDHDSLENEVRVLQLRNSTIIDLLNYEFKNVNILISDIYGRNVIRSDISNKNQIILNHDELPKGVVILYIYTDTQVFFKDKIIVLK